jgi:hypothetical protein
MTSSLLFHHRALPITVSARHRSASCTSSSRVKTNALSLHVVNFDVVHSSSNFRRQRPSRRQKRFPKRGFPIDAGGYEGQTEEENNALENLRRQRNQRDVRREGLKPFVAPTRNALTTTTNDRFSSYWEDEEDDDERNDNNKNPPNPRGVPPRWQNVLKKYVLNPYGVFALVALLSVLNPQYIDKGRSNLAMQLYNRDTPGDIVAYKTKDGNLFKVSKDEGIITYNGKDGMVVDSKGGVWIAVARKDQPEIVKEKYYVGQIEDVPVLPKNPTKGEQKLFDKYMQETFAKTLQDVPKDLKKVYNTKDPEFILPLTEKEIAEDGYYFGDEEDWMARRD